MRLILLCLVAAAALTGCGSGNAPSSPSTPSSGNVTSTVSTTSVTTTVTSTTTTTAPARIIVREATFENANGYQTSGTARIVREGDTFSLEFLQNFRTSQSPLLDVRLCTELNCRSGPVEVLGDLQRFSGAQAYPLADAGSQYDRVVIYCRGVHLAFGYGLLR